METRLEKWSEIQLATLVIALVIALALSTVPALPSALLTERLLEWRNAIRPH